MLVADTINNIHKHRKKAKLIYILILKIKHFKQTKAQFISDISALKKQRDQTA